MKDLLNNRWVQPLFVFFPLIPSAIFFFAGIPLFLIASFVLLFKRFSASGKYQIFFSDFTMGRGRIILGFRIHKNNNIYNCSANSLLHGANHTGRYH